METLQNKHIAFKIGETVRTEYGNVEIEGYRYKDENYFFALKGYNGWYSHTTKEVDGQKIISFTLHHL